MKMKHIPNAITISRFFLVAGLLAIAIVTASTALAMVNWLLITLYVLAGVTDMVDGPIARRIKDARSELGAELDSMADMFLVVVSIFVIMPQMDLAWSWLWPGMIAVLGFKFCSIIPGILKHKKVFFLHTYSNKLLGAFLFFGVIFYFIFGGVTSVGDPTWVSYYMIFLIAVVIAITLEEIIIISTLDYPAKDIRGIWQVNKINTLYRETGNKLDLEQGGI